MTRALTIALLVAALSVSGAVSKRGPDAAQGERSQVVVLLGSPPLAVADGGKAAARRIDAEQRRFETALAGFEHKDQIDVEWRSYQLDPTLPEHYDGTETEYLSRIKGMPQVRGRLTNDVWAKYLIHAEENVYISKMFEMITPAALQAKIAMLKAKRQLPELDKRLLQDPKNSTVTFAKTFFWAASILGVHAPELYVRSDIPGSVVAVPMLPPASLAPQRGRRRLTAQRSWPTSNPRPSANRS